MVVELFQYLTTPCSWRSRKWGYLSESIGISARYQRCQKQWQSHLDKTKECITRSLRSHPEVKSILFCGSGAGLDIPWSLPEFKALDRIILVDLVHPWSIRWRGFCDRRIELHSVDLSGVTDQLEKGLDYPAPQIDWSEKVDLVVSLNVMSQLPLIPLERMEQRKRPRSEAELHAWGRQIQKNHLDSIMRWGSLQLVISDIQERWLNPEGEVLEIQDPWYGAKWFDPEEEWEWFISPVGESDARRSKIHRVGASSIISKTSCF